MAGVIRHLAWGGACAIAGATFVAVLIPSPKHKKNCDIYRIAHGLETPKMIVHESEANTKICPIMSYRRSSSIPVRECAGTRCMAWRPYKNGLGFCGLSNPARDSGTPDEAEIKNGDEKGYEK